MTDERAVSAAEELHGVEDVPGEVLGIDYDTDVITVRLRDDDVRGLPFEAFDASDVFQMGQRFRLSLGPNGEILKVSPMDEGDVASPAIKGYVESVDPADELVWVYLRDEEGWHRKVMPLELFRENGLAQPGRHFLLRVDEAGTPLALEPDDEDLQLFPLPAEETKPRWTNRPAAEAN